jgi:tetrahydromethanopterin S-methyltransferase subunit G
VQKRFDKMTNKLDKIDYRVKVMENEINQDFNYEKDQI